MDAEFQPKTDVPLFYTERRGSGGHSVFEHLNRPCINSFATSLLML